MAGYGVGVELEDDVLLLLVRVRVKLPLKCLVVLFMVMVKRLVVEESENEVMVLGAGEVVEFRIMELEITVVALEALVVVLTPPEGTVLEEGDDDDDDVGTTFDEVLAVDRDGDDADVGVEGRIEDMDEEITPVVCALEAVDESDSVELVATDELCGVEDGLEATVVGVLLLRLEVTALELGTGEDCGAEDAIVPATDEEVLILVRLIVVVAVVVVFGDGDDVVVEEEGDTVGVLEVI